MNKRTTQIILLVASVLALIYIVLDYYGMIRYAKLYCKTPEYYIDKYSNLPKKQGKIVVCFAVTSKEELNKVTPFIKSLLDQSIAIDDIGITAPYGVSNNIPESIRDVLSSYGHTRDYDDANGLVCTVLRETEENTKIIILEPNTVYGYDFIQTITEESEKHPSDVIHVNSENSKEMLVKPKFFSDKISGYEKGTGCLPWLKECQNVPSKVMSYFGNYKAI
jgi:preprotein translocase subunit SecE